MKHIKNLCQATLKLLLAITIVFSTGISGVFADQPNNLSQALEKQSEIVGNLFNSENKSSYENALSFLEIDNNLETVTTYLGTDNEISKLLTAANNLDDNDPQTALEFIKVVDPSCTDENLEALRKAIDGSDINETTINGYINEIDKTSELSNLSTLILSVASNKESFSVSTLIEAVMEYKTSDELTKLKTLVDTVNSYNSNKDSSTLSTLIEETEKYNSTTSNNLVKLKSLIESANDLSSTYITNLTEEEKTQYVKAFTELLRGKYREGYTTTPLYLNEIIKLIDGIDIGLTTAKNNVEDDTTVTKISIYGVDMEVDSETGAVYVPYIVEDVDVNVITDEPYITFEINKPTPLVVGENTITITIKSLSGKTKTYTYTVTRESADDEQGDGTDEVVPTTTQAPAVEPMVYVPETTETTTSYVASSKTKEEVKDETENEETKKDDKEYDEEVEEEKGLNGFTILLIVAGIALIGFGIYMLFGDKDDEKPINYSKKSKNNKKRK